jgi:hypothetical protein
VKKNKPITLWEAKKYNINIYLKTGFPVFILLTLSSHDTFMNFSISFITYHLIILIFPIPIYHTKKGKHYLTKPTFRKSIIISIISIGIFVFWLNFRDIF